jgi:hypothetical protein
VGQRDWRGIQQQGDVVFVVDSVSLLQVFLRILRVSPVNVTAPIYHTLLFIHSLIYSFIYPGCSIIRAVDCVVNYRTN